MNSDDNADPRVIDPHTGEPMEPMAQPGYYPGFSTLGQQNHWDATTREVVLDRVENVPPIRFFTPYEAQLLEAICDRVLPQDDRIPSRRIPIVPSIDKKLYEKIRDGYRYENMPHDREAFQLGLKAIDEIAQVKHGAPFIQISKSAQETILRELHDGKPAAADEVWKHMPVAHFWMLLVGACAEAYYAHPWAWDEIGFGGPAYPRAYMRLERGEPEPWEVRERRYEWDAPPWSQSAEYEMIGGEQEQLAPPGQGGTH
jgi:hypothetical protein